MRNKIKTALLLACLSAAAFPAAGGPPAPAAGKSYNFGDPDEVKKSWVCGGKQFCVPMTGFSVVSCPSALNGKALEISAKSSAGVLVTQVPESVWRRYPVLRWRWRVLKKISFKGKEPDDQAAVIYFGDGTMIKKFMVGYRWEHSCPLGDESHLTYIGGTLVRRICMRNSEAVPGKWYVEERNVLEDFRRAFRRMPRGVCGLTIGGNSQHSGSETLVQIDYIEFLPVAKKTAGTSGPDVKTSERKNEK